MNGRELTAEDVVYSMERFRTVKGNANAYMLASVDKVEAVDKYTVRFTFKEPFVWFLDVLANPMAACIVAKEAVEKFGDLKKWEAVIGTGPWMLDSYRPNVGYTYVRNPAYFVSGLPYIDKIEAVVDEDNASRMAAFLAGKYDLGWENPGTINRVDHHRIDDPALGIDEHTVLVIRGAGPLGYPGAAEVVNMQPPVHLIKRGVLSLPCIGDGRQSGTSGTPSILNASPEAAAGGGLALLRTGDRVRIDLNTRRADILMPDEELANAGRR